MNDRVRIYELARQMNLLPANHANRLTPQLEKTILDTFCLQIINEYDIANDAEITAKRCQPCRNGQPGRLGPFLASFMKGRQTYADPYRGKYSLYWLTIENGEVVAVDEQYVP